MESRYKRYKKSYQKYDKEHKVKIALLKRNYVNKQRFGGNRDKVLERDNWTCQKCGMTNEQHIVIFARQITVDHIDGNENNYQLNNLQTLCLRCHGRKDKIRGLREKP